MSPPHTSRGTICNPGATSIVRRVVLAATTSAFEAAGLTQADALVREEKIAADVTAPRAVTKRRRFTT